MRGGAVMSEDPYRHAWDVLHPGPSGRIGPDVRTFQAGVAMSTGCTPTGLALSDPLCLGMAWRPRLGEAGCYVSGGCLPSFLTKAEADEWVGLGLAFVSSDQDPFQGEPLLRAGPVLDRWLIWAWVHAAHWIHQGPSEEQWESYRI